MKKVQCLSFPVSFSGVVSNTASLLLMFSLWKVSVEENITYCLLHLFGCPLSLQIKMSRLTRLSVLYKGQHFLLQQCCQQRHTNRNLPFLSNTELNKCNLRSTYTHTYTYTYIWFQHIKNVIYPKPEQRLLYIKWRNYYFATFRVDMTLVGKQFSVLERETSKEMQISERSDEDKKIYSFLYKCWKFKYKPIHSSVEQPLKMSSPITTIRLIGFLRPSRKTL